MTIFKNWTEAESTFFITFSSKMTFLLPLPINVWMDVAVHDSGMKLPSFLISNMLTSYLSLHRYTYSVLTVLNLIIFCLCFVAVLQIGFPFSQSFLKQSFAKPLYHVCIVFLPWFTFLHLKLVHRHLLLPLRR